MPYSYADLSEQGPVDEGYPYLKIGGLLAGAALLGGLLYGLFLLVGGGKKNPEPPPLYVYERPGTGIRIPFPQSNLPEEQAFDFNQAEISLIVKALDTLTVDQLKAINAIAAVHSSHNDVIFIPQGGEVVFRFTQPQNQRTLDPNLGNEFLNAIGLPSQPNVAQTPPNTAKLVNNQTVSPSIVSPENALAGTALSSPANVFSANKVPTHHADIICSTCFDMSAESAMVAKQGLFTPTLQDLIRPHGKDFVVMPAGTRDGGGN